VKEHALTLDGYYRLSYGARLAVAQVGLPHTGDRWEEGEQHVNPYYDHCYAPPRWFERTEQDLLWENKIWVTLTGTGGRGHGYVSPQHWTPDLAQLVSVLLGRVIKLTIKLRVPPWGVGQKSAVCSQKSEVNPA
jgi:hypothetical protein